jgi:hypothetical protein
MADRGPDQRLEGGISPDQARADYLEDQIEQVRRALAPLIRDEDLEPRLRRAWAVLERLPPLD